MESVRMMKFLKTLILLALASCEMNTAYAYSPPVSCPAANGFLGFSTTTNAFACNAMAYANMPALSANQLLGALTATTPSGQSVPSCSAAGNALNWTSGTGFGCATGYLTGNQTITLSGDTTGSGSTSITTSTGKVNGGAIPASATALASNSSNQIITATYQGNGSKVQLSTGTTTTNDCVKFDVNGNTVDAGSACSSGGVTSFSGDGTILSNSGSTGAVTATLANAAGGTVLANPTGSSTTPVYEDQPVLGINGSDSGTLGLANGGASGATITIQNLGATSAYNFNLPTTAGGAGQILTSQGGGSNNMTWASDNVGGGMFTYSDNGVTLTANTYFMPPGGGGIPQTTEANVDVASPSATTVTNLQVGVSAAPGTGNSYTITFRDAGADTTLTCVISGASATSCNDTSHSVNVAQNDLIDWKIVSAGTIITTPTLTIAANNGTSNVGVTSISTNNGLTGGIITTTGTIGLASVSNNSVLCNNTGGSAVPTAANCTVTGTGNAVLATSPTLTTASLGSSTATTQSAGDNSTKLATTAYVDRTNLKARNVIVGFDGGGAALTAGKVVYLANSPCTGTIASVTMLADVSGSAVVDVWKVAYASAPPTVSNTITASDLPTLSSAQKSTDSTLTGWTTSVTDGDTWAFKLNSASTITELSLVIRINCT